MNKKAFHPFEPGLNQGLPEAAKSARADGNAATVANLAIVYTEPAPVSPIVIAASVADFRIALAKFRASKPASAHFRHDQAWWAAEMFLNEWEILAVTFDWTVDDIFALPRGAKSGLAYWFGVEIVRALGPEHAVTEAGRVFDRITRLTWFQ